MARGLTLEARLAIAPSAIRVALMSRVVVNVMPKPEILDPQGKAVTGALKRLGFQGLSVRQGKRFEIEVPEGLEGTGKA